MAKRRNGTIDMGLRQAFASATEHAKTLEQRIRERDCTRLVFELFEATDAAAWARGTAACADRARDRKRADALFSRIQKAMWKASDLVYEGKCRRTE